MASLWKKKLRRGLFSLITPFSAAARRAQSRIEAREMFEMAQESGASAMGRLKLVLTESFLKHAGADLSTDKPYKEILGLKGGKADFDDMVNKATEASKKREEAHREKMKNKQPGKPQV